MNTTELDALLKATLRDDKLSGSEKSTLATWVAGNIDSEQDRAVARSRVFDIAAQVDADKPATLKWVEMAMKAIYPVTVTEDYGAQAFFSPGEDCYRHINHRLSSARTSVDLCVFTITDNRIARVIEETHRRGVKVRIISDNDKAHDEGSDIIDLARTGIAVKVDVTPYHMHHKYAIFDNKIIITGSYNWTRSAAEYNEENIIDSQDPQLIAPFVKHFAALWAKL